MLTKEQILQADDSRVVDVEVPEWGGTVRVTVMTGADRDRFEADTIGRNGSTNLANIRARLAAMCIVDDQGERMFTSPDDVKDLGHKSAAALDRVFEACQRLNGLRSEDVDELVKASRTGQADASGSG
jgi:hypothetical protein